jgi:hypothetical protein
MAHTSEQRERLERDGFLVLEETGCPPEVIDGVVEDLDGLFEGDGCRSGGVF